MSLIIGAVPLALSYGAVISAMQTAGIALIGIAGAVNTANKATQHGLVNDDEYDYLKKHIQAQLLKNTITDTCQEFQTPFTDIEILTKTLEEYGCENIYLPNENTIECNIERVKFIFSRNNNQDAFKVKLTCREVFDFTEKMSEINQDYRINVQEDAYNTIIERLNNENLNIESEEILEDDSIMLTINLD